MAEPWKFDTNETVGEELAHQIATIGENMNIRRFQQVKEENGFVGIEFQGSARNPSTSAAVVSIACSATCAT